MKEKILIAIPAYNCEKQISRLLRELFQVQDLVNGYDLEILVIDNGSRDQTAETAKEVLQKNPSYAASIIRNKHNLGLGGSQKAAFLWAAQKKVEILVVLHGDHQATPRELPGLLEKIRTSDHAAILGSRFSRGSVRSGYSKMRVFGNSGLNVLYSLLTGKIVADLGSGMNVFRISHFDLDRVAGHSNGFSFNMDLLLDLIQRKKEFRFSPITWTELDQVSNARNFRVGWLALKTLLVWRFGRTQRQENLLGFGHDILLEQGR